MAGSKPRIFDAQFVDRFIRLPDCCSDCFIQSIIYWLLIFLSVSILYIEWLLSLSVCHLLVSIFAEIMRSFSVLMLPAYFRYLKPKFARFLRSKSFRRNSKRHGMHRNTSDIVSFDTKLGGRVYFDVTRKMARIERPHPDQLEGEPRCNCCPPPMSGQRMLIVGEYAYVYGGLCQRRVDLGPNLSTHVWRLSLLDNTWKMIPLEQEAHNITPISYSWIATRKWGILTFGGTGFPFGQFNGDRLCRLTLVSSDNGQKYILNCFDYEGTCPPACYGASLVADEDNDCIYLMGGTDGHEYYEDVFKGTIKLQQNGNVQVTWEKLSEKCLSIGGRYRHESVIFDDKLLLFGGGNNEVLYPVEAITYFDLDKKYFGVLKTEEDTEFGYPPARDSFALTRFENTVYLMGGRGAVDASIMYNDIWSLDLLSMRWSKSKMTLSFKTSFHAVAIDAEGKVYIFGGQRGGRRNTSIARTNMVQSFLASPPRLQSICKRFIAQTYKKGMKLSDDASASTFNFICETRPYYNGKCPSTRTSSRVSSNSSNSFTQ